MSFNPVRAKDDIDPNIKVIDDHLDDFACNRMVKLAKELNIDISKMQKFVIILEP